MPRIGHYVTQFPPRKSCCLGKQSIDSTERQWEEDFPGGKDTAKIDWRSIPRATVRFGEKYPGFADQDIEIMKQETAKCVYARDLEVLINPPERLRKEGKEFSIEYDEKGVRFNNLGFPSLGGKHDYLGVCDDFARRYKTIFEAQFGKKYTFQIRFATDPPCLPDCTHYFLVAWPKSEAPRITEALAMKPDVFPKGCLVLDPSLNALGAPGEDLMGYALDSLRDECWPPTSGRLEYNGPLLPSLNCRTTNYLSLGFLGNLDSKFPLDPPGKRCIVLMGFRDSWGMHPPKLVYALKKPGEDVKEWENWRFEVSPGSLLQRFADKVEGDLRKTLQKRYPKVDKASFIANPQ